jgi:hypothetical protein
MTETLDKNAIAQLNSFAESVQATAKEVAADHEGEPRLQAAFVRIYYGVITSMVFEYTSGRLALRDRAERNIVVGLFRLGAAYTEEMSKCGNVEAKLSQVSMACSLLEVLLMLSCIRFKQNVVTTKSWRNVARRAKKKTFASTLQDKNVTISSLIEIGQELGWFGNQLPVEYISDADKEEVDQFIAKVPKGVHPMSNIPTLAKDVRNMLHPGKCLRENLDPSDPDTLETGIAYMGLTLAAYILRHADEPGAMSAVDALKATPEASLATSSPR